MTVMTSDIIVSCNWVLQKTRINFSILPIKVGNTETWNSINL